MAPVVCPRPDCAIYVLAGDYCPECGAYLFPVTGRRRRRNLEGEAARLARLENARVDHEARNYADSLVSDLTRDLDRDFRRAERDYYRGEPGGAFARW